MDLELNELEDKIIEWAKERDLLKSENKRGQFLKVAEEVGEIAASLAEDDNDQIKDAIGDTVVTLVILANQCGLTLKDCTNEAYDDIKDREGETVNGVFIKDK